MFVHFVYHYHPYMIILLIFISRLAVSAQTTPPSLVTAKHTTSVSYPSVFVSSEVAAEVPFHYFFWCVYASSLKYKQRL